MGIADKFTFMGSMNKQEAMIVRFFFFKFELDETDELPLKETVAYVAKATKAPVDDVVALRRKMSSRYGLLESYKKKKQGNKYYIKMTPQALELWDWMISDEGSEWGTFNHVAVQKPVKSGNKQWDLGDHGVLIDRTLPRDVWRQLTDLTKARGWITALVPNDGAIAHAVLNPETGKKGILIPTLTSREVTVEEDPDEV